MKRSLILISALCAVAALLVCTGVDFDNPLDDKGNNFLYGRDHLLNNRDAATRENGDGVSALFDSTSEFYYERFVCDMTPPTVTLVGAPTVNLTTNQTTEFQRLMGNGATGFVGVVNVSDGVISARLTRGGAEVVQVGPTDPPPVGQFIIIYTAQKAACPDGEVPPPGEAQRGIIVTEHIQDDNRPPNVQLTGNSYESVALDSVYVERGARAFEANGTQIPITIVELRDGRSGRDDIVIQTFTINALTIPAGAVTVPTDLERPYILRYHTRSLLNDSTASVDRTVNVARSVVHQATPVIVLETYTHRFQTGSGTVTINHPDTAVAEFTGRYTEKGVKRVYYLNADGDTVTIPTSLVVMPSAPNLSGHSVTVTYTVPAGAGYRDATATRAIHIFETQCDMSAVGPPLITFDDLNGSESPTINVGNGVWTPSPIASNNNSGSGYTVRSSNTAEEPTTSRTRRYMIDFGGLNPNNLRPGTYTLRYVGLSQCGMIAVRDRVVRVQ